MTKPYFSIVTTTKNCQSTIIQTLNSVKISKEKNEDLINFFETLEDDDDVQNIYSNAKLSN